MPSPGLGWLHGKARVVAPPRDDATDNRVQPRLVPSRATRSIRSAARSRGACQLRSPSADEGAILEVAALCDCLPWPSSGAGLVYRGSLGRSSCSRRRRTRTAVNEKTKKETAKKQKGDIPFAPAAADLICRGPRPPWASSAAGLVRRGTLGRSSCSSCSRRRRTKTAVNDKTKKQTANKQNEAHL